MSLLLLLQPPAAPTGGTVQPVHVGGDVYSSGTLSNFSGLTYPTGAAVGGIQAGDVGFLVIGTNTTAPITTPPSGWATYGSNLVVAANLELWFYTRTMTGGETGAISWSIGTAATKNTAAVDIMRGPTGIAAVANAVLTPATATTLNAPTAAVSGSAVETGIFIEYSSTPSTDVTLPTELTLVDKQFGTGGGARSAALGYNTTVDTDGAVGAGTWTRTSVASSNVVALTVAWAVPAPPTAVTERWQSRYSFTTAQTDITFQTAADTDADFNYIVQATDTAVILLQMVGSVAPSIDWHGQSYTEVQPLTAVGGMVWGVYTMTGLGGGQDYTFTLSSPMVASVMMHGYATGGVGNTSTVYARPGAQTTTALPGFTGQHPASFVVDVWAEQNNAASATTLTPSVGTVRAIAAPPLGGANTGHPAISLHTPGAATVPAVTGTYNQTSTDGAGMQLEMLPVGVHPSAAGAATLTATSTLTAAAVRVQPAVAAFAATSTLTAAPTRTQPAAATLTAASTLTAAATRVQPAAATLTATSTLTATAGTAATVAASAALTTTSTLTATATRTQPAAAPLTAASTLTTTATRTQPATAALTAAGTLTAGAVRTQPATATLTAVSTLTATGTRTQPATATLTSTGTLTADATPTQPATATLTATTTLTADAVREATVAAALTATSVLTTGATREQPTTVALTATSTLTLTGTREQPVGAALVAASTLTGAGTREPVAAAALTAVSTLTAGGRTPGALLFVDDFNGTAGTAPSAAYWTAATGAGGWGNSELQFYTTTGNAAADGAGNLAITARQETVGGAAYTSARIHGNGKVTTTYGRIEARIKVPKGQGLWPAFWMMADETTYGSWPRNGEIDIMEIVNQAVSSYHSLHGPTTADPAVAWHLSRTWTSGVDLSVAFHLYAVEWEPDRLSFYVDTTLVRTFTTADMPAGSTWPFNGRPFYPLLNLAVGGGFTAAAPDPAAFPATMLVDYVRIYEQAPYTQTNPKVATLVTGFTDQREFDNWGPNVVLVGGQAQMTLTAAYPSLVSQRRFDLTNSAVSVRLVQPPNVGAGTTQAVLQLTASTGNRIEFGWQNNQLYFQEIVGGVTDATYLGYSATAHRHLRVAHDGTNVVWSTSPDGATWTTRRTKASTLPLTGVGVNLVAGYYGAETTPGTAVWDDLNVAQAVGAAALTATATLSGDGVATRTSAAALTAVSTLTAGGTRTQPATAALTAASTLTGAAVQAQPAAAALTATATLTAGAVRAATPSADLTATATLTAVGVVTQPATVALIASSTLTATAGRVAVTTATLTATSTLTVAAVPVRPATAALSAVSTLTATGTGISGGVGAILSATATLTAGGLRTARPAAALTATAVLTATGARTAPSAAPMTATSTLTVTLTGVALPAAALTATSTLAVAAARAVHPAVALYAAATLYTAGERATAAAIALEAVATLATGPAVTRHGTVTLQATAVLLVAAVAELYAAAALEATGTLTVDATAGTGPVFAGWGIPF